MAAKKPTAPKVEKKEVATEELLEKVNVSQVQRTMAERYKSEELVEVIISPLYANEFSNNMPIVLNGVRINIPIDGRPYKIPYSFALEVKSRIAKVDEKAKRFARLADVSNNFERSPGELKLFR